MNLWLIGTINDPARHMLNGCKNLSMMEKFCHADQLSCPVCGNPGVAEFFEPRGAACACSAVLSCTGSAIVLCSPITWSRNELPLRGHLPKISTPWMLSNW